MSHASPMIEQDINAYLKQHEQKELLRFITCGSVDDGKSTLIGRLLHDSQMIFEDHLAALTADSKKSGTQGNAIDFALLVDGLQSEREQGITIDVAYRYFSTEKRKFIIADTPGHEQYTRNMATGASNCDLAIILIDASKGVQAQTRRHSFICSLLGIKHIIVAVNKMDLVDYSQARYKEIQADYLKLAGVLAIPDIRFVPIAALTGDNVVQSSERMSWFRGSPLMHYLETTQIEPLYEADEFRFPVQRVARPDSEFRGYQGTIAAGRIATGDTIRVLPSGQISSVKSIVTFDGELEQAQAPMSVTLILNDNVDVSRGDMIARKDRLPSVAAKLRAKIVWMHNKELESYHEYTVKFITKTTRAHVSSIHHKIDVNSLQEISAGKLEINEIGSVDLQLAEPVAFDAYEGNRATGAFILIDRLTNATVGAGMIESALSSVTAAAAPEQYSEFELELNALIRKHFPHWHAKDLNQP